MPAGERCRRAVCGRTARTVRCGGGRQPRTSRPGPRSPGKPPADPTTRQRAEGRPAQPASPSPLAWYELGERSLVGDDPEAAVAGGDRPAEVGRAVYGSRGAAQLVCGWVDFCQLERVAAAQNPDAAKGEIGRA